MGGGGNGVAGSSVGAAGRSYGGGGGGASRPLGTSGTHTGGAGANGVVIIEEFF